ncbi:hypothetical protein A3781_12990 [Bacillus badius]|nr:hypothetical protein A3781_12990 [Bacillus badius]
MIEKEAFGLDSQMLQFVDKRGFGIILFRTPFDFQIIFKPFERKIDLSKALIQILFLRVRAVKVSITYTCTVH